MSSEWRLAINSLAGRRRRTVLLALAVALSTALVAAVACGMGSINAAMMLAVETTLGRADLRVKDVASQKLTAGTLELFEARPEVEIVAPRARGSIPIEAATLLGRHFVVAGTGIDPARQYGVIDPSLESGRRVENEDEIVLNTDAARALRVEVGERIRVDRPGPPVELVVVGIAASSNIDVIDRYEATVTLRTLEKITLTKGGISELAVVLRDGVEPDSAAEALQQVVPPNVIVQTTALVTAGVERAMQARQIGFGVLSAVAMIAAAYIVLTGLTTNVLERQRELAIMRCIGAERGTLARAQLVVGAAIGLAGAVMGLPLGMALVWILTLIFPDKLPAGVVAPAGQLLITAVAPVAAGLVGAAWPAITAGRTTPLRAMTGRAATPKTRSVVLCGVLGLACIALHFVIALVPTDENVVLWGHVAVGVPLMFAGYVLIAVPLSALIARSAGPVLSTLLRLPRGLMIRSIAATPFRYGATAGAMMVGMAMMASIWTMGSALLRDGIGAIQFPDAFVHDWNGLEHADIAKVKRLDFVRDACPLTYYKIDNTVFGIEGLKQPPTNFIAFEPKPFFDMTKLEWVAGDEAYARRRLDEGGAVLVAKEFLVARRGYEIGDSFTVTHLGNRFDFEIVGAVSSPGLDLVGYAFDIGKEYASVALGTVFGTRADLKRVFGSEAVHLIQMQYATDITSREASDALRAALGKPGVLVGDGREIKDGITQLGASSMKIGSIIAIAAMLIGCLSVGNVVLAGVEARRFEFGVLRAVGAGRWMLGRLIIGEVLIMGITACILGTAMSMQDMVAAMRIQRLIAGLELRPIPPLLPIASGWAILLTVSVLMVSPIVVKLARMRIRELLATTRG